MYLCLDCTSHDTRPQPDEGAMNITGHEDRGPNPSAILQYIAETPIGSLRLVPMKREVFKDSPG